MSAIPITEMLQRVEGWWSQAVLKELRPLSAKVSSPAEKGACGCQEGWGLGAHVLLKSQ